MSDPQCKSCKAPLIYDDELYCGHCEPCPEIELTPMPKAKP